MEVTPNWQHHSNKLRKPKRNPVAIRQSRARLQALKLKLNFHKSKEKDAVQ